MHTIDEINARLAEIRTAAQAPDITMEALQALTTEAEELRKEKTNLEQRAALRARIAAGEAGEPAQGIQERAQGLQITQERTYDASSPEYRTAWLKNLAIRSGSGSGSISYMFGDMTAEERRAFTFTTANTGAVVPKAILDRIVELVRSQYPMYSDATKTNIVTGFGVPRHKSIDAGDAAKVTEGTANTDEQDTFDLLDIVNEEIKKTLEISRKMVFASIDAFEDWIVSHISKRIAVAKEKIIITQLDNPTYGMDGGNAALTGTLSDEEVRKIFAAIDQDGLKVVYANAKTIWNVIAGLENAKGEKLFIPSTREDALISGRIYGAPVKPDANIPDNTLYVGVPTSILANDASEYELFSAIDPKTLKSIYTGFSLFGAGLENPKAFAKYVHSPA